MKLWEYMSHLRTWNPKPCFTVGYKTARMVCRTYAFWPEETLARSQDFVEKSMSSMVNSLHIFFSPILYAMSPVANVAWNLPEQRQKT